jgi:hypothetical protein
VSGGTEEYYCAPDAKRAGHQVLKLADTVACIVLPQGGQVEDVVSVSVPVSTLPPVLFAALNAQLSRSTRHEHEPDGSVTMVLDKNLHLLSSDLRDEICAEAQRRDDILDSECQQEDLADDATALLVAECARLFHGLHPAIAQLAISGGSFAAASVTVRVETPSL